MALYITMQSLLPVPSCWAGCKPRPTCNDTEKGLFVDARYLQLTDLEIPYEVEQRNLRTLIITEETARETFQQQAAVIEKETEQLVGFSVCFSVLFKVVWSLRSITNSAQDLDPALCSIRSFQVLHRHSFHQKLMCFSIQT